MTCLLVLSHSLVSWPKEIKAQGWGGGEPLALLSSPCGKCKGLGFNLTSRGRSAGSHLSLTPAGHEVNACQASEDACQLWYPPRPPKRWEAVPPNLRLGVAFLKPRLVGVSSSVLQGILLLFLIFLPQTFHDLPFSFLLSLMFALLG